MAVTTNIRNSLNPTSRHSRVRDIYFWQCKPNCHRKCLSCWTNAYRICRYDEWFKNIHNFDDYLVARNQLAHAHEPDDPLYNPYTWTHKQDGTPVWAIMAQDPEKIQTFQVGMAGIDVAIPVVGHFDFSVLKSTAEDADKVELVDVGGGHGACLKQILVKHPELNPQKVILQDRPDVIEMAKGSSGLPKDLVYMAHDFRTEQPVKGMWALLCHGSVRVNNPD